MSRLNGDQLVRYIIVVACLVVTVMALRHCGTSSISAILGGTEQMDTVVVTIHDTLQMPPLIIRDTVTTVRIAYYGDTTVVRDTAGVTRMAAQIDSLRLAMTRTHSRRTFTTDTITTSGDTIHIECDETTRAISLWLRSAPVVRTLTARQAVAVPAMRLRPYVGGYLAWRGEGDYVGIAAAGIMVDLPERVACDLGAQCTTTGQIELRAGMRYYY